MANIEIEITKDRVFKDGWTLIVYNVPSKGKPYPCYLNAFKDVITEIIEYFINNPVPDYSEAKQIYRLRNMDNWWMVDEDKLEEALERGDSDLDQMCDVYINEGSLVYTDYKGESYICDYRAHKALIAAT